MFAESGYILYRLFICTSNLQSSFTSAISSAFLCSGSVFFDSSALNIIIIVFRTILSLNSYNWLVSVPSWSYPPVATLSLCSSIKALTSSRSNFCLIYFPFHLAVFRTY
jgi:hypothetical protein